MGREAGVGESYRRYGREGNDVLVQVVGEMDCMVPDVVDLKRK